MISRGSAPSLPLLPKLAPGGPRRPAAQLTRPQGLWLPLELHRGLGRVAEVSRVPVGKAGEEGIHWQAHSWVPTQDGGQEFSCQSQAPKCDRLPCVRFPVSAIVSAAASVSLLLLPSLSASVSLCLCLSLSLSSVCIHPLVGPSLAPSPCWADPPLPFSLRLSLFLS